MQCENYISIYLLYHICLCKKVRVFKYNLHRKKDFVEVFKNLARYRSKNNFVGLSK